MDRRNLSKVLLGSVAGSTLLSQRAQAQTCTPPCFPLTSQESSTEITPVDYSYPPADLRRFGGVGNGTTACAAALQNASTVSAAGGGNVIIEGGSYRIESNTVIAAGVTLEFRQGGLLTVDSGVQLSINGSVVAPPGAKIFAGSGVVKLGTAKGAVPTVYPEWFGAVGNGVVDCTSAIQKCVSSLNWGGIVQFAAGVYLTSGITALANTALRGVGKEQSLIKSIAAQPLVHLSNGGGIVPAGGFTVRDLTLDGNGYGTIGLQVDNYGNFSVQDCAIYGFSSRGVYFHGVVTSTIYRCRILNCPIGFEGDTSSSTLNAVALRDCAIGGCTNWGVKVTQGSLFSISGGAIEACGTSGISSTGGVLLDDMDRDALGIAATLDGVWMEDNNGHSAIRINAPHVNYSIFDIKSVQVFGGSRSYGIYVDGSGNYSSVALVYCTLKSAATQDLFIGTRAVGTVDHAQAGSASISAPDVVRLNHPINGRYQFPGLALLSGGQLIFESLPGNHANDADAATGGIPIGGVYRNGGVLRVRVS
ncbi:right-handed parallel beta-helix repeat-containing protein [Steroidobacter flavus]|uniref:Right-handed parallel beta-helix repeat-containing protein n=1 Tax=Steroidobacter flavus TaxID=1842136 RepID=A0ABV8SV15_9GAMM